MGCWTMMGWPLILLGGFLVRCERIMFPNHENMTT